MNDAFSFSYPDYLEAKETVDDRALNREVWSSFLEGLAQMGSSLRLLEVGGGTGATLLRFLQALEELPATQCEYVLVDERGDNLDVAQARIKEWATATGGDVTRLGDRKLSFRPPDTENPVRIHLEEADFWDLGGRLGAQPPFDAILGQAVFDLYDVFDALKTLDPLLRVGGLWYLPIHYDGKTSFEPTIDATLDHRVERCYHASMNSPNSGRALLTALRRIGAQLRAVGASDWVVFSDEESYKYNEKYFLRCILSFFEDEIEGSSQIEQEEGALWIHERQKQLHKEVLIYISHQIDICAEKK